MRFSSKTFKRGRGLCKSRKVRKVQKVRKVLKSKTKKQRGGSTDDRSFYSECPNCVKVNPMNLDAYRGDDAADTETSRNF
jgi:hypothetical protein